MRWAMAWVPALVCVLAVGCGPGSSRIGNGEKGPLSPERVAELENGLRSKPPLEAAQTQYRTAVKEMADAIAALVPGLTWRFDMDTWNGCGGDYEWTRAKTTYLMVVFSGPIPDDQWAAAVQIVKNGARKFGAGTLGVMKDKPGDHDVYISGAGGVEFKLSTQKAGVLTAQSDCRISQTDTPTPSPTRHP